MSKFNIPSPKSQVDGIGKIPPSVAEFREEEEPNLKIDFRYYNDKVCEIELLSKKAKKRSQKN